MCIPLLMRLLRGKAPGGVSLYCGVVPPTTTEAPMSVDVPRLNESAATPAKPPQVRLVLEGAEELLGWLRSLLATLQALQKSAPGRRGPRLSPDQAAEIKRRAAAGESKASL